MNLPGIVSSMSALTAPVALASTLPLELIEALSHPYTDISLFLDSSLPQPAEPINATDLLDLNLVETLWPRATDKTYQDYQNTLSEILSRRNTPHDLSPPHHAHEKRHPYPSILSSLGRFGHVTRQQTPQCYPPSLNDIAGALACANYFTRLPDGCYIEGTASTKLCSCLVGWALPHPESSEGPDPNNATEYVPRGATILGRSRTGERIERSCLDVAAAVYWVIDQCRDCGVEGQEWCSAAGVESARGDEDFLVQTDAFQGELPG